MLWNRRSFLRLSTAAAAGHIVSPSASARWLRSRNVSDPQGTATLESNFKCVNPLIGTGWRGHMFPGAVAPFGLLQLSPDTSGPPEPKWNIQGAWYEWQHCSGYHYNDNVINGFSHTHVQGTGGIDLGDLLVMPIVEGKNWYWDVGNVEPLSEMQIRNLGEESGLVFSPTELGHRSFFSHAKETARPGFYSVHLDTPDVFAELTATTRCGMHRYHYPEGATRQGVMVDLAHGLNCKVYAAELTVESTTRISGRRSTHGWAADRDFYFVMEFSEPAGEIDVSVDGAISRARPGDHFTGKDVKLIFSRSKAGAPILARVGISPVSVDGAARNLQTEINSWNFDAIADAAAGVWAAELARIDASSSSQELMQAFYSGFYHSLVAPATYSDADGTFRGQDRKDHPNPGFTKYTTLSIWDIYRGEFPFLTLTQPERIDDIVRTLILDYEQLGQHSLPMWPLWGNETWSMIGFHAAGMILSAYVRGFRGFDIDAAYAAVRDTALVGSTTKGNAALQAMFRENGYVPHDLHPGGVSSTLDLAYDYWCAGALAKLLGKKGDAEMFFKLGQNYRNLFNPSTGFMQGRSKDGHWHEPFRPDQETDDYVETDGWQASFSVPHDIQGLIALHGGDAAFVEKLDALFTAPSRVIDARPDITGMVGQDAQGNEPSNHHPYLFSFAGAPWKTQYWTRKVAALYNNTPSGIPGNDDCGQLASWFVFAALGFYPVNAANGVYVIGSPLMDRVVLRNEVARTNFTIVAENNSAENIYIQSAKLNGKELTRSWITHAQIIAGGELHFRMGATPNKNWGSAPQDRPPSGLLPSTL